MTLFDEIDDKQSEIIYGPYVGNDWAKVINNDAKIALDNIMPLVLKEYDTKQIYPDKVDIFKVFHNCKLEDIKVVILGQDPYYNGNANGNAFGCKMNVSASLSKMLESLQTATGRPLKPQHPNSNLSLDYLVQQGVFLLNVVLTVEANKPESHAGIGWQRFTKEIIKIISKERQDIVFMLWGNYARAFSPLIHEGKHEILEWTHPASAARNNTKWNCPHFKTANEYLQSKEKEPIVWY